jgi:PAS domain S-box-containing protein
VSQIKQAATEGDRLAARVDVGAPAVCAAALVVLFAVTLPFAHRIAPFPAIVEFGDALLVAGALLVAAMSFVEFRFTARRSLAIAGAAFLFYALDALAAVVPQFFPPDLQVKYAGARAWLYVLRHLGFACLMVWYGLEARGRTTQRRSFLGGSSVRRLLVMTLVGGAVVIVFGILAVPYLPGLLENGATPRLTLAPLGLAAAATAAAVFLLLRIAARAELDLWLAVMVAAIFLDMAGHANEMTPMSVSFYVYRFEELAGLFAVLGFLTFHTLDSYRIAASRAAALIERHREQQRRFIATVNSAAIGIAHLDRHGRFLFANELLGALAAREAGELIDRASIWEVFAAEPQRLCDDDGASRTVVFEGSVGAGSSPRFVHVAVSPSRPRGPADYWIAIVHDVTERKRAEQTIRQLNDLKSQFIETVTHEIRTPLSGIVSVGELLKRTALTPEQARFAETIDLSAQALLRLIDDVLDFSKIDGAKIELERTLFDLMQLVESVVDGFAMEAARRDVRLIVAVAADATGGFYGDPGRLRQVLSALITNALKVTEHGEIRVTAELAGVIGREVLVTFRVADTGVAIPQDDRPHVFDVVPQTEGPERRYVRSGLGLAIARRLVELMGGRIGVTCEEGTGTTFSFTLALEREADDVRLDRRATSVRGLRCIVVSADPGLRELLERMLLSWGMLVRVYDSAASAVRGIESDANEDQIDCAVIDGELAASFHLLCALSDDRRFEDARFVFLEKLSEEAAQMISAARRQVVRKPVSRSSLYEAIDHLCVHRSEEGDDARVKLPPLRFERILVAEDDETNRMLALAQLEQLGFGADYVEDGAGAIAAAKTGLYALILMDGRMPRTDGFEATRAIREHERIHGGHLPIIAVSASTSAAFRERCLAAGMDDFLAKPVLLSSLQGVLDRWLSRPAATAAVPAVTRGADDDVPGFERLKTVFRGDAAAIQKVLESALRTLDDCFERIGEAAAARDAVAVAKLAHRMAGVALDVEFPHLTILCRRLESSAGEDVRRQAIDEVLDPIETAIETFRRAVATERAALVAAGGADV